MIRRFFTRSPRRLPLTRTKLGVEFLESRETPTVNVLGIGAQEMASDRSFFLPIAVTNSPNGNVTHAVNTNSTAVSATLLTGRTVQFHVSNGLGVEGNITIQLFDDIAPQATQRIVDLINSGFYTQPGKQFFRIDDLFSNSPETNFIIQGGGANNTDNSTLPSLEEEINRDYTFASNGLVALAKTSFPVSSNSQFFFTDLDRPLNERIEFLNYRYTIFGIITGGFDVYTAMKNAPRTGTQPSPAITITSASVLSNSPNGVIRFTPAAGGFLGNTSVTIQSTDSDGTTNTNFTLTGVADTVADNPPFLEPVPNTITGTSGQTTSLTLTSFDREGDAVTYVVRDTAFSGAPANLGFSINQATGVVSLTPLSTFTGTIQFTVGVRQADATDAPGNYAAQLVTMTVTAPTTPPASTTFTASGSAAGTEPRVVATNSDGSPRFSVLAFELGFTGGVRTTVADVMGDSTPEVIVVPAFGGASVVKVLDGTDGRLLYSRIVFEESFRGGLYVDSGDALGLGYGQVLVGAGESGGPRVTLLDVRRDLVLLNYFAADSTTRGGISVDIGEIVPGRGPFIVTGGGPGNGPVVNVYAPATGLRIGTFLAGETDDRRGIRVRVSDSIDTATNARPVIVAPFASTSFLDETEFNAVPFLTLT